MAYAFFVTGVAEVARNLGLAGERIAGAGEVGMDKAMKDGAEIVKAAGYGPINQESGDHYDSIKGMVTSASAVSVEGQIYSDLSYSWRLEAGFYDMTDVLGRTFFQDPRPHFEPSEPEIASLAESTIGNEIQAALA